MTSSAFGYDFTSRVSTLSVVVVLLVTSWQCQSRETWWSKNFPGQPDPTVCPELSDPAHGRLEFRGEAIRKATYVCNTNYSVVGDQEVVCSCGEWSGPKGNPANSTCKRDGQWSMWSNWTECSLTCGGGRETRTRSCSNPPPEPGGMDCLGDPYEIRICNADKCPVCSIQSNIKIGDISITPLASGSEVSFSCPDEHNFRLEGPKVQSCVGLDLSKLSIFCIRVCPQLDHPVNGNVTVDVNRTVARYSCPIGFSLQGPEQRDCDDGVWSGTDPVCNRDLISADDGEVEPTGVSPRIGLGQGVFDINSPQILISQCNGSTSFNLRTTTTQAELKVTAILFLVTNETVFRTEVLLNTSEYLSDEARYVCVPLICNDTTGLGLPQVGQLRITVEILDGTAEFSNVNFLEGTSCEGPEDSESLASCDNGTASGDCGFRNTGCGTEDFDVSLTDESDESYDEDDDDDDDGDEKLVKILNNQTAENCENFGCLSCLRDSGYSISARDNNETTTNKRKKRAVTTRNNKSFCVYPKKGVLAFSEIASQFVKLGSLNEYYSFFYNMRKRGFHYLNVYVQCRGYVHRIQIGKHGLSFVIANYNGGGSHGQQCLKLHTRIKEVLKNKCTEFRVIFQVAALKRAICVNNMRTLHWKHVNSRHCRHVVNI